MSVTTPSPAGRAYLLLPLAALCWSGNHIVARAIAGHVPPWSLNLARWLIVAVIAGIVWRTTISRDFALIWRHKGILAFLGMTGAAIFGALQYVALETTSAMNMGIMNSVAPVFIATASFIFFRDRLTRSQTLGILVSLAGVLAIVTQLDAARVASLAFTPGDLLMVFNMSLWAMYSSCLRLRPAIDTQSFLFAISAIGAVALIPFAAYEYANGRVLQPTALTFGAVAYAALAASLVAYLCWSRGVELIGANRAGVFLHLVPIYNVLLAGPLLGEPLRPFHFIGFVLILTGVFLTISRVGRNR